MLDSVDLLNNMTGKLFIASDQLWRYVRDDKNLCLNARMLPDNRIRIDEFIVVYSDDYEYRSNDSIACKMFENSSQSLIVSCDVCNVYDMQISLDDLTGQYPRKFKLKNWNAQPRTRTICEIMDKTVTQPTDDNHETDIKAQLEDVRNSLRILNQKTDMILDHLKLIK